MCEKTYYYWQRKLREKMCGQLVANQEEPQVPATFAQVCLPAPPKPATGGKLTIRLNGAEVEIYGDMPVATVEAVLRVLAGR